jgi:hypothetical protein
MRSRRYFSSARLRRALLGAASYGCIVACLSAPKAATAQGLDFSDFYRGLSVSVEGGSLVNSSPHNFTNSMGGAYAMVPNLTPGRDGYMAGAAIGQRLGPWDWSLGWHGGFLDIDSFNGPTTGTTAYAKDGLLLQTIDPEAGYHLSLYGSDLRLFAGARALNVQNRSAANYSSPANGKLGNFDQQSSFWGAGPRAGAQATLPLSGVPFSGSLFSGLPLSVVVGGSGSAIFGEQNRSFEHTDTTGTFVTTTTGGAGHAHSSPVIYNAEASIALDYKLTSMVDLAVGYRAQQFWNAAPRVNQLGGGGAFNTGQGDILIHGPFAKITVTLP